jgi:hypothetical protein
VCVCIRVCACVCGKQPGVPQAVRQGLWAGWPSREPGSGPRVCLHALLTVGQRQLPGQGLLQRFGVCKQGVHLVLRCRLLHVALVRDALQDLTLLPRDSCVFCCTLVLQRLFQGAKARGIVDIAADALPAAACCRHTLRATPCMVLVQLT